MVSKCLRISLLWTVAVLILCATKLHGQVNYRQFKDLHSTCSRIDSASVMKDFVALDTLRNLGISGYEDLFLEDLGMNYYYQFLLFGRRADLDSSISVSRLGWESYKSSRSLWILAFNLIQSGQFEEGIGYLETYVELLKEQGVLVDYEQVYRLYKKVYEGLGKSKG